MCVLGIAAGQSSTTFLQIGDWIYPLVPGVSPCFHTEYGAFILPDLHSDVPGKHFCNSKLNNTLLIFYNYFRIVRGYYSTI